MECQISGQRLRVQTPGSSGLSGHIYDDGTQQLIATNGYHEGISVKIDGIAIVFDNLYPEGIEQSKWRENLVAVSPLKFIEILF